MLDDYICKKYAIWKEQELDDPDLIRELADMEGNEIKIKDSFYRDLEFGTGGLRGVIGVGTNRMNLYTVAKATQGYSNYLNHNFVNPSVAIAYDSRNKSDLFSQIASEVFTANGIKVFIYRELMPTPALSFAIRHLHCDGGIVITASHNPSKYNGYKVYGKDGCQITTSTAEQILGFIDKVDLFLDVIRLKFCDGLASGKISYIEEDTITEYIHAVTSESLCKADIKKDISIIYTPLNGAGRYCVTRVLEENGFNNVTVVKEQEQPDGNFPTCPYPNPEIKDALELGIEYAKRFNSDLLLATDPDCDRVGTAVREQNGYRLLSGNEMGMLLFEYICKRRIEMGNMPANPVLIKTIVTIDMVKQIAESYGVQVIEVLTGFKFIGEQIGILEEQGEEERYLFGFEESYGYLSGTYVRDKDGVDASLLICEMYAYYKSIGKSLLDVLNELYSKYGFCENSLRSYIFEGAEGFDKMKSIMSKLRKSKLKSLAGKKILSISDYKESKVSYMDNTQKDIYLPKSDVLKYELDENCSVVIRPSGTEPKIKLYLSISGDNKLKAKEEAEYIACKIEELFDETKL